MLKLTAYDMEDNLLFSRLYKTWGAAKGVETRLWKTMKGVACTEIKVVEDETK